VRSIGRQLEEPGEIDKGCFVSGAIRRKDGEGYEHRINGKDGMAEVRQRKRARGANAQDIMKLLYLLIQMHVIPQSILTSTPTSSSPYTILCRLCNISIIADMTDARSEDSKSNSMSFCLGMCVGIRKAREE
jgi:hypothetical protein